MKVACPRCEHRFDAPARARNIECPSCAFVAPTPDRGRGDGMEAECPRCAARVRGDPGKRARCPNCGFKAKLPGDAAPGGGGSGGSGQESPAAAALELECPRCSAHVQAVPGVAMTCPSCGYADQVPGQTAEAGRVVLECPRCGDRVEGRPGEKVTCGCGYEAVAPSP